MTISEKDFFLALLSMDSYNRGYDPGISGLGGVGTGIGNATFNNQSVVAEGSAEVAAGFYAAAYTTEYGTVISYRGTDVNFVLPWSDSPGSDMWNGYGTATGNSNSEQARLAAEFYQAVTGTQNTDPRLGDVILTGHSLGGGRY